MVGGAADMQTAFDNLVTDLRPAGDPDRAPQMAAYMKDHFAFLGIASPVRKSLQRPLLRAAKSEPIDDILAIAEACWRCDEREFHHVACDLIRAQAQKLTPMHLQRLRQLITTNSWWDTVDSLASHSVGSLVRNFPELGEVMDEWIDDDNMWIARTAILHQLRFKDDLDQQRLFAYVDKRAADTEFFIRKALGWALRQHARVAPDAVRQFVAERESTLSGLTRREATKHL